MPLGLLLILVLPWGTPGELEVTRTCEPIRIDLCKGIGYNVTGMPNFVGHDLQQDAQMQLQTFAPLVQYECSSRLRFFLCSVYLPMCTEKVPQPIGPCRPLCESVQSMCEPVLLEFGFLWPAALNCSQFPPANNEKHMCMEGPEREEQRRRVPFRRPSGIQRGSGNMVSHPRAHHAQVTNVRGISRSLCKHLRSSDRYYFVNGTGRCAPACHADVLYSRENKQFAQVWVAVWACLCFLSTLFTLVTFFTNSSQFRYPERIIVILSGCYFIYSIAYFIRLIGGREDMGCHNDAYYGEPLLIQAGLDNINCTVVFMLLYFFGMASVLWWVLLTINWFLAAGLRWSPEVLERFTTYYHLLAWTLPSMKTISILILRGVDADELTGTCFVGNQDPQTLMRFVIVPSLTYLCVGCIFLIAGMLSIYRTRHGKSLAVTDDKWHVLMIRIGIFALLYTIPATCILVANFYEFNSREAWLSANSSLTPNVEVFTLKIFMSLVVGITTGVWLWTSRTPFPKWESLQSKFCIKHRPNHSRHVILFETLPRKFTVKGNVTVV